MRELVQLDAGGLHALARLREVAEAEDVPGDLVLTLPESSAELAELLEHARTFASRALAPSTERAYRARWDAFASWCDGHGLACAPARAEVVALYLASLAREGLSASSLDVTLGAIAYGHRLKGLPSPRLAPIVQLQRRGIRRTIGTAQREVDALLVEDLRRMLAPLRNSTADRRDRALLLLGFVGALRRSELVGLDVPDVRETSAGLELTIRRSKGDPEGRGACLALQRGAHPDTCPVRAIRRWLEAYGCGAGPLFVGVKWGQSTTRRLDAGDVARIMKRRAEAAGLDCRELSGHSLRAGFATAAALAGKPPLAIQEHLRHRSISQTMRYVRRARLFQDNVTADIGL